MWVCAFFLNPAKKSINCINDKIQNLVKLFLDRAEEFNIQIFDRVIFIYSSIYTSLFYVYFIEKNIYI